MSKLHPLEALAITCLLLIFVTIVAFSMPQQSPTPPINTTNTTPAERPLAAPPGPVVADSELLLIFQAHRVTSELIEARLKAAGIPELQQELRVLRARYEAWYKAHNVPAGWVWNDVAKQFEPAPIPRPDPDQGKGKPAPSPPAAGGAKKEN